MRPRAAIAVAALAVAGACAKLDCEPRALSVTGDLSQDILGSWDGFGVDSRVVFTFLPDGGLTVVEEPNMYAVGGNRSRRAYQLLDGGVDLGYGLLHAEVSGSELTLSDDAGYRRTHQALSCRGPEFQ